MLSALGDAPVFGAGECAWCGCAVHPSPDERIPVCADCYYNLEHVAECADCQKLWAVAQ